MRWWVVVAALGLPSVAHAEDGDLTNFTVGPVLGVRISGGEPGTSPLIIGLEGGAGYGPERVNIGFEHRSDHDFGYIEIDPWYLIGGSFGFGVNENGDTNAVLGFWEGLPVMGNDAGCNDWHSTVTVSGGYRYTGVHELYLSVKAGTMHGNVCFD
jgi:hypothetical protein